jgi:hypothetical protein
MKEFFRLFWNDSSVVERTVRVVFMAVGSGLMVAPESSSVMRMVGAGCAAAAVAIGAGEKNPPQA